MEKLKILVIDDKPENIASVIEQLKNKYDLTTTSSYEEVKELLNDSIWNDDKNEWQPCPPKFDVVLTDLFLPAVKSGELMVDKSGEHPYGLIFILMAIKAGVKMIGIVSSQNHHQNSFYHAIGDLINYTGGRPREYGETILHGICLSGTKRWNHVLEELINCSRK